MLVFALLFLGRIVPRRSRGRILAPTASATRRLSAAVARA